MDGENNEKPYKQWIIWVGVFMIFGNTHDFVGREDLTNKNRLKLKKHVKIYF